METWVVTNRALLRSYFGSAFRESALPALTSMESRTRDSVQDALVAATRRCPNAYRKGKRSFHIVGRLSPAALRPHLHSFARRERILSQRL